MTVAVTGAAGHLGGHLVRALLARGKQVRAIDYTRDWRTLVGLDVEIVSGDIRDLAFLRQAFAGTEVVYHTAAIISLLNNEWPLLEAVNVLGTRNVVQACLDCQVRRLVHFSSIHALIQDPLDQPLDESSQLVGAGRHPPYDRSKAAGEREVQKGIQRGLDAVILNPTGMLGPLDFKPSYFGSVLHTLARGRMPALVESGFDWVDVRDVAEAAARAGEVGQSGARYLLSGHWASLRHLAQMIEQITGVQAPRLVCPMWLARVAAVGPTALAQLTGKRAVFTNVALTALRGNHRISHERARRDLGYQPRPLYETLADTLSWFAQRLNPRRASDAQKA